MIGYLKGFTQMYKDFILIQTNGVGYKVFVGDRTLSHLKERENSLFICTYVKEDRLELYGFETQEHLQLFELLLDVSGVGPKTALDIVDQDPERIVQAVQNAEVSFFKAVPRIGKKTAQKIILDLKSKLGSLRELSLGPRSDKERDVYETLTALGYEESEIGEIITELNLEEASVEQAVKQALKLLGS
jgi:Holliday junction DNA helicase RuvA